MHAFARGKVTSRAAEALGNPTPQASLEPQTARHAHHDSRPVGVAARMVANFADRH